MDLKPGGFGAGEKWRARVGLLAGRKPWISACTGLFAARARCYFYAPLPNTQGSVDFPTVEFEYGDTDSRGAELAGGAVGWQHPGNEREEGLINGGVNDIGA